MKKQIITMLLIPFFGMSQINLSGSGTESYLMGYGESANYVRERMDGTVEVYGDSLTAIKMLLKTYKQKAKEAQEVEESLHKSVQWSNTVSDYFKKSKSWLEYRKSIKKQGYFYTKKRK